MDNKRLVIGMVLAMAVVFGWQMFVSYMYKKNPNWKPQNQQTAQTTPATGNPSTTGAIEPGGPTTGTSLSTQASGSSASVANALVTNAATQPSQVELGAGDSKGETFPLKLELNSAGAGIELATLKRFKDHDAKNVYTYQSPPTSDPHTRPLATTGVTVNGTTFDLSNVNWNLESNTDRSATYAIDLSLGGVPIVRVRKTYEITDSKHSGEGFNVNVKQTFENLTDQAIKVSTSITGPTLPPWELERGPDRQIIAGYPKGTKEVEAAQHLAEEFKDATPRNFVTDKDGRQLLWAGAASVYFEAILRPESLDPASVVPKYLSKVEATALNPEARPAERQIVTHFVTNELTIAPKSTLSLPMELYLGPKLRKTLNNPYYAALPRGYNAALVISSGLCAICTFQPVINALVAMLGFFHTILRDWGLSIIALVVIVRTLLHPITKRSQMSMLKMGKMGPEIERLKKKYGDDKDELNKAMMQVYKQQGFTPVLGCLPMFLQMPIWIALYAALNSTFELRQEPFLWGWTWIHDLARPDHLITWAPIRLFWGIEVSALNILPILLAVVFFLQQKYTPKPPATTPEQAQQQKMMQWMSLLFPIFLYNGPSGLNLYILTSTTIGIVESKRIRDHIKEREEAEKAGKVIVDAKPTRQSKKKDAKDKEEPKKKTGLGGWLADLQAKAEEIRREADKKRG